MGLQDEFPNLGDLSSKITSPPDSRYNCIAWALADDQHHWWWPSPRSYWPIKNFNPNVLQAFLDLLEMKGWQKTTDLGFVDGEAKIALYWGNGSPTHAARLTRSGLWSSKLGKEYDIMHDIEDLYGPRYGNLYSVFAKRL